MDPRAAIQPVFSLRHISISTTAATTGQVRYNNMRKVFTSVFSSTEETAGPIVLGVVQVQSAAVDLPALGAAFETGQALSV